MKEQTKQFKMTPKRVQVDDLDTVKVRHRELGTERDLQLLTRLQVLHNGMEAFRQQRSRGMRFVYGDQLGDYIRVNGKMMTEREYLVRHGQTPLQTNQLKKMVNSITGMMVKEQNEPVANARDRDEQQYGELMTIALQANCNKNQMNLLYENAMDEYIIGGLAVIRESYEYRNGREDSWSDVCNPNYMILDAGMKDPRFWDMNLVAQLHDVYPNDLKAKFVHSQEDLALLQHIYPSQFHIFNEGTTDDFTRKHRLDRVDFYTPSDPTLCRIYECWTKEGKMRYKLHDWNDGSIQYVDADDTESLKAVNDANESRKRLASQTGLSEEQVPLIEGELFFDEYWYCRFLAVDGTILWEGESPFADRSHPYTIVATPFTDGRICGYIIDGIDHNKAINRALILYDWLIRTQAKGVVMVPNQLVPDDMTKEEFAAQSTSIDGFYFYEAKEGVPTPTAFHGAAVTFNASDLIRQLTGLLEQSTAVSGALQGKTPYSGTSAALYAQQTANSSTPLASLLSKFRIFMEQVAVKKLKNIKEFYDEARLASIAGRIDGILDNPNLNLNRVCDIEFDLSIKESTETPAYRMLANDYLTQLLGMGAIGLKDWLKYGQWPFADKMLQDIEAREAEANGLQAQGQLPQQPSAEQTEMLRQFAGLKQ